MSALFLDHGVVAEVAVDLEKARVAVRRAKRHTTKAESKGGMEAHRALHEAELALDRPTGRGARMS